MNLTLINAMDLAVAQTEETIQINARLRDDAYAKGDITYGDRLDRFSKRLLSLHSKLIVARAEVSDLCLRGCVAVTMVKEDV